MNESMISSATTNEGKKERKKQKERSRRKEESWLEKKPKNPNRFSALNKRFFFVYFLR
ncbi:MAG: hypothetical protein Q8P67_16940 [archaeon]|nr:hypothetical protein [archaeon]